MTSTKRTTSITMPAGFISSDEEECSISTRHSGEESSSSRSITTAQELDETHYRDYLRVAAGNVQQEIHSPKGKRRGPRGGVVVPFPVKLYNMLKGVEQEGLEHIVSWQPHGRCFMVHQPKEFVEEIMPRYFRQTKLTSFQRQLNLYGFLRLTSHRDRGGYYHEIFLRGRDDLAKVMLRTRVKGNGIKGGAAPSFEPDFYSMPFCNEHDAASRSSTRSVFNEFQNESSADMPSENNDDDDYTQVMGIDEAISNDIEEALLVFVPESTYSGTNEVNEIRPVMSSADFESFSSGMIMPSQSSSFAAMPMLVLSGSIRDESWRDQQQQKPLSCPPALSAAPVNAPPRVRISVDDDALDDMGFFEGQCFRFMDDQSLHAFEMAMIRNEV